MSIMQQRADAVRELIGRVIAIQSSDGVTRASVDAIRDALIGLASRTELFPAGEFAVQDAVGGPIRLAEDADHNFALYAVIGRPGYASPVHNHTTWAAIAGVRGAEHNIFYERIDNDSAPGQGRLRPLGEHTVVPGTGVAYLPDDFHEIAMVGDGPWLQLHLYGRSLEHLPGRIRFASRDGGAYEVYPANPTIRQLELSPAAVRALLADEEEMALLDVEEEAAFSRGHPLLAVNLPTSRLERDIALLVPRRGSRVVVSDAHGSGPAHRAARRLFDLGWTNIAVLRGGTRGWTEAGYEVFTGFNVPGKAFGELVEHAFGTPHIEAAALKQRLDAGEDIVILDSRPLDEFRVVSIPGGIDAPGVELLGRVQDLVASPETLVVVNCAGRTRSIIGAQLLRNAGLANPVVALKDGTAGWQLAGFELAHGETRLAPPPGAAALAKARQAAQALAQRFGVPLIGRDALAALARDPSRSLYRFDVRLPEEYRAGHLPGFRHSPGGQLVQSLDQYAATRHGRIVLADDDGVRARLAASWLVQFGWGEVFVLEDAFQGQALEVGEEPPPEVTAPAAPAIFAHDLHAVLQNGQTHVIDLQRSQDFARAHVPSAIWASRTHLGDVVAGLPPGHTIVLVSPDGLLARFAAAELPDRRVLVLEGGLQAWRKAGLPLESGTRFAHEPADAWLRPDDGSGTPQSKMRGYLQWEVALPGQIARDGQSGFRIDPAR